MLTALIWRFVLLGVFANSCYCESDSEPSDATSRIRIVQYQPATVTKVPIHDFNRDNAVSPGEYHSLAQSPLDRKQDSSSGLESQEPAPVPKNYAFSYAIRDRNTGDDFSHIQAHNGEATKGEYRVKLPDGRVQIVTYTADNGGYRADIRYDKGETSPAKQSAESNHQHTFSNDQTSFNSDRNSLSFQPKSQEMSEKKDSPLVYFNEIRTFSDPTPTKPANSYETVEHVDEEPYPYSKKLLEDVNYLLKYVTPTVETKTENVFDITPDSKVLKNRHFDEQNKQARDNKKNRESFRNIPHKLLELEKAKFGDPVLSKLKFEKLTFDSLPPFPNFNISSTFEPPRYTPSQYSSHESLSTPKYDSREYSPSSTPSYQSREQLQFIPRLEHRAPLQQSTPTYEPREPPFSTTIYDSRERFSTPSEHPSYSPTLGTVSEIARPRYETKAPQFSTTGYEPQDRPLGTPRYETKTPQYTVSSQPPATSEYFETPDASRYQSNQQLTPSHDSGEQQNNVKYETERYEPSPYIPPQYNARPFNPSTGQQYNQIEVSVYHVPKFENFENLPANVLKNGQPTFVPTSPGYTPQHFIPTLPTPTRKPEYVSISSTPKSNAPSPKYNSQEVSNKFNSQEQPPVSAVPEYNSQEYPPVGAAPRFNPKDYPPVSAVPPKINSEELNGVTQSTPLFTPTTPTNEGARPAHEHHFGKIEIPQYLHIHRYEDSGENAKPKELIYYTPLQIPIPNSIAYLEHGSQNATGGRRPLFNPSFITMTEHPRIQNAQPPHFNEDILIPEYPRHYDIANVSSKFVPDVPSVGNLKPDYNQLRPPTQNFRNGDFHSPPVESPPSSNENKFSSPPPQEEEQSQEHQNGARLSDLARIYSGYFDFIPPNEIESDKETSKEYRAPPNEHQSAERAPFTPSTSLPEYYYDFSTASPAHRYISSEMGSQEMNSISDDDQLRNSSFRTSAYLRPLRKERVYIHHNALPTAPTENQVTVGTASPSKSSTSHKDTDVSIVKSISSSIPPELLKDFDLQLRSSIYRGDSYEAGNEVKGTRSTSVTTRSPKLNEIIVKKLQDTIPSIGKVYLKTPTTKRTVR